MLVLQNRLWATLYLIVAMSLYVCYSYLFKWFGTLRYWFGTLRYSYLSDLNVQNDVHELPICLYNCSLKLSNVVSQFSSYFLFMLILVETD
jgi:hypothetical protein